MRELRFGGCRRIIARAVLDYRNARCANSQPNEPDREAVHVAQADLDAVVVCDDGDDLAWNGSHGCALLVLVE
jgi:hypothetical protein